MGVVPVIFRNFALHVDNCPNHAREFHGKYYANVVDDCNGCSAFNGHGGCNDGTWIDCALMDDDPEALEMIENEPVFSEIVFCGTTKYRQKRSVKLRLRQNKEFAYLAGSYFCIYVEAADVKGAELAFAKKFDDRIVSVLSGDRDAFNEKDLDWIMKNINQPVKSEKSRYYFPSEDLGIECKPARSGCMK